jgi:hypothetical protein
VRSSEPCGQVPAGLGTSLVVARDD